MGMLGRILGGMLGGIGGYYIGKKIDENPQKIQEAKDKVVNTVKNNKTGAILGSIFLGIPGAILGAKYIKF